MTLGDLADFARELTSQPPFMGPQIGDRLIKRLRTSGKALAPIINGLYRMALPPAALVDDFDSSDVCFRLKSPCGESWLVPAGEVPDFCGGLPTFTLDGLAAITEQLRRAA